MITMRWICCRGVVVVSDVPFSLNIVWKPQEVEGLCGEYDGLICFSKLQPV
jgi:hypothetical protein